MQYFNSVGILSMSAFDDPECSTHFHDGRMEIYDSEWKILLTGTRCNDNLYYFDQAHIERALSIAQRMYTLPQSIPESKSDTSGTDIIEDEDTETSEFISEDDDEHHQIEKEDEDAEAERWYRDLGMTSDEADELFIEHLQELQDPNHPFNRRNSNVVGDGILRVL